MFGRKHRGLLGFVAVVAVAMVGGVLPQSAASATAGGQTTIYRDDRGVPHVYASTARGLFVGAGYAIAQDRLWQADLVRRTGSGTLSEILGPGPGNSNVGSDQFFRLFTGGQARRQALYDGLSDRVKTVLTAYRDGFNRWITEATKTGRLPVEYRAAGLVPRPWTTDDIVATAMLSILNVGAQGADELANAAQLQALVARLGPAEASAVFADAHWLDDPSAPTTIPAEGGTSPARDLLAHAAAADPVAPGVVTAGAHAQSLLAAVAAVLPTVGVGAGPHSNAVAISGRLSADGHPLLLGGPQVGYSVPQAFAEIGLHGAGYDATGVAIAGSPGVQIGVGRDYAWTVTSGGDDNQDWYVETVDPVGHPGQYLFNGVWRSYSCHPETIAVRGAPSVVVPDCESVHGPVLSTSGNVALSLRDVTREDIADGFEGFLGLDTARSRQAFFASSRRIVGSFNLVYANTAGDIGYAHVGHVPIRPVGDNRFLPHPGDGTDEWRGFVPAVQLPLVVNPGQGWLANWNTKPQAGWTNSTDGFWQWGPVHRSQVLMRQLAALPPHSATVATVEAINRTTGQTAESPLGDDGNVIVQTVLPLMLANVDNTADPRLPAAIGLLAHWDQQRVDANGDGSYDSPAVTVFDRWYAQFVAAVFAPKTGPLFAPNSVSENTVANLAVRLLQGANAALPLQGDYLAGRSLSQATTATLVAALDQLTAQYETADTAAWLTPDLHITWTPLGAGTVPDTIWMNRGTYNQIIHLGPGAGLYGENVVPPGQSGDPASPHFADQLNLYASWQYKTMRLDRADLTHHTESAVVLETG